jgi:hypothetical protein
MRIYDVYRHGKLVARVRIFENGKIEWAYRHEAGNWQGFWWSNEIKSMIEHLIQQHPGRRRLAVSEFTIRRRRD